MRANAITIMGTLMAATAVLAAGCGSSSAPLDAPAEAWPQPDTSEGLVNASTDLRAVLESEATTDACQRYRQGQTDRRTTLLCGKWMFFYESFNAPGPPSVLLEFVMNNFPEIVGPGFSKLGMIQDPTQANGMPLGLALGGRSNGVPTHAFTCASCHFAKLPDGRFAVGAPNHDYDYGMQTLTFALFPLLALGGDPAQQDPAAVAKVAPMVARVNGDPALKQKLLEALNPIILAGGTAPSFSRDSQRAYATWLPGTQDFLMEPVPIDDKVHTVSKISALWGIPNEGEVAAAGLTSAMLGWTGGTRDLGLFMDGFVALGFGKNVGSARDLARPLVEYVFSLRAPKNPAPPAAALVRKGEDLFAAKGCTGCHDGPRGSGKRLFDYAEIGTDDAMRSWGGKTLATTGAERTGKLKSPRLAGAWTFRRFLHNGSVGSLEELFCVPGPREKTLAAPFGDQGHDYTCGGLSDGDKAALIAFLRAN